MSSTPARVLLALGAVAALTGCQKHEFEPPDREAQVADAETLFSTSLFDSLTWESDEERHRVGNAVYAEQCRRCHGTLGEGGTDFARERDLDVPSLVEPGWAYENHHDSVRHRIFVGHAEGMPTWGIAGITPREIDASAHYILDVLRPDVLGGGPGG